MYLVILGIVAYICDYFDSNYSKLFYFIFGLYWWKAIDVIDQIYPPKSKKKKDDNEDSKKDKEE